MINYLDYLKKKGNSKISIIVIGILIISIPIILSFKFSVIGNVLGLTLVGLGLAMFYFLLSSYNSKHINRLVIRLTKNDLYWLNENIPFYRSLKGESKKIFENRLGLFLGEIAITEVDKEVADKSTCLYVASAAVITYWGLPYWNYGELREVLVYPDNFDEDKNIASQNSIQGQVHHGGLMNNTMILSRKALVKGFRNTTDGHNVGIHEFTHLLDKADGSIDGLPVGLTKDERAHWLKVFEETLDSKDFKLNPYAKTNNAEFFAVSYELLKEQPNVLKRWHPELYDILSKYSNKEVI